MKNPTPKADQLRALRVAAAEAEERMKQRAIEKREKKAAKRNAKRK